MKLKRVLLGLFCAGLSTIAVQAVHAQGYPNKPIRVVVPYGAGGPTDLVARTVFDKAKEGLNNQPYIIENRPGGGLMIGVEAVVRSAPDGYTLLLSGNSHYLFPALQPVAFDIINDLTGVTRIANVPLAIATPVSSPFKTLEEMIAYARANPGKLTYGTSVYAGTDHLAFVQLSQRANIKMVDVPYKGAAATLPDLIAGRVDLQMTAIPFLQPHVDTGKLRILVVAAEKPTPLAPNLPITGTMFPGFDATSYAGIFAPGKTPREIIEVLDRELRRAVQSQDTADKLKAAGYITDYAGPEVLNAQNRREWDKARQTIQAAGLKPQ